MHATLCVHAQIWTALTYVHLNTYFLQAFRIYMFECYAVKYCA